MWFFRKKKDEESTQAQPQAQTTIPDVTVDDLKQRLEAGADLQVVDVRERWEWQGGHIERAIHIPLGTLATRLDTLDKSRDVFLICKSGMRSAKATYILRRHGFEQSYNVSGGMIDWHMRNYPTVQDDHQS